MITLTTHDHVLDVAGRAHPAEPFDLHAVQALYDQCRYLDAYALTQHLWRDRAAWDRLDVDRTILAARLATRLGGTKIRRHLLRQALRHAPTHPGVRYFARGENRIRYHLIHDLMEYDREPELEAEPELQASWLASQAVRWARVRDFDRAHALIDQAMRFSVERSWVHYCHSDVLIAEDRWEEALSAAETALALATVSPWTASALGRVLVRFGRIAEAAVRLLVAAEHGQSREMASTALWHLCAWAERVPVAERAEKTARVRALSARLDALAPLADRDARDGIARVRLDVAEQWGDRDEVRELAATIRSPFHRKAFKNMEANPLGERRLLPFVPRMQKRLTCLPTSIACIAGGFGVSLDEDELAAQITYDGTRVWEAAEALVARGFAVRHFMVHPALVEKLLDAGVPFVLHRRGEDHAHSVAVVGMDHAARTVIIHDPSETRLVETLLDHLTDDERPIGPRATVLLPKDRAHLLDLIPEEEHQLASAYFRYFHVEEKEGIAAAQQVAEEVCARFGDHPVARYLHALSLDGRGRAGEAMTILQDLVSQHPACVSTRRSLIETCRSLGNDALLRETLRAVVERGMLPGVSAQQTWRRVPTVYINQLADELSSSAQTLPEAERLLWNALRDDPTDASTLHILSDIHWAAGRSTQRVLPARLAALLNPERDHYSRASCDAWRDVGREEEGLTLLRKRVEHLGSKPRGAAACITLVDCLEDYGRTDEAVRELEAAEFYHQDNPELCAFAAGFWMRIGQRDRARRSVERLQRSGPRETYLTAAVRFHESCGEWEQALPLCTEWVALNPGSLQARQDLLRFMARRHGRRQALELARQWCREQPDRDDLEYVLYQQLGSVFLDEEQHQLLLRRTARNPDDAWAWRGLAVDALNEMDALPDSQRGPALQRAEKLVAQAERTSPIHPLTMTLRARMEESAGRFREAIELHFRVLATNPDEETSYERIWDCSARLPPNELGEVMERMDGCLRRIVGPMEPARSVAMRIAQRLGVAEAEAALDRWSAGRTVGPETVEARADVLLTLGQGRSDAERALALLEPVVARHPEILSMRLSHAHALWQLQRPTEAISVLQDVVTTCPTHAYARRELARRLREDHQDDRARSVLEEGLRIDPLSEQMACALADLIADGGHPGEAADVLVKYLAVSPESVRLREACVDALFAAGRDAEAVETAREGTRVHPDGAYMWLQLARALACHASSGAWADAEAACRKALEFNSNLFEAADQLATLLVRQDRFDEAENSLKSMVARMDDPAAALGRLAWVARQRGDHERAVREMAAVVQASPQYAWGWRRLFDWLEEDKVPSLTKEILAQWPAGMMAHAEFRSRRLSALEQAGVQQSELDGEWNKLLADFPRDEELHLLRADVLWERQDPRGASAVVETILKVHPDSTYVLARWVRAQVERGSKQEAMDMAIKVWTTPGDDEEWPERTAWNSLCEAGWQEDGANALKAALRQGTRVRLVAVAALTEHMVATAGTPPWYERMGLQRSHTRAAKALREAMDLLDATDWAEGKHRSVVFRA